jgi:hypothetical protein
VVCRRTTEKPIEPALSAQAVTNDFQGLFHVGAVSPKGV